MPGEATPGRALTWSAYAATSGAPAPWLVVTAIVTGLAPVPPNSVSIVSATVRELWSVGITELSMGVHSARVAGAARASMTTPVATAIAPGRRITACERRYQRPCSALRRGSRRASFAPHRPKITGEITSAAMAATTATVAPASPMDLMNPRGKTVSAASATATVLAEKATVRPAVRIVVRIAPADGPCAASSSR